MIKKLLLLGFLTCATITLKPVVAVGDTPSSSTTFQFSVGLGIYDATSEKLWTLSGQDTSSFSEHIQSYGVASTQFMSVSPNASMSLISYPFLADQAIITTNVDGSLVVPDFSVDNPLLGQAFSAVTFVDTYLATVATNALNYVYLLQSSHFDDGQNGTESPDGYTLMSQFDIGSSNSIAQMAGSTSGSLIIASSQGTFGTDTSQVSFALTNTTSALIVGQKVNCVTLVSQASQEISSSTSVLTAGEVDLSAFGSSVAMYPSSAFGMQMYVGLDVTAGVDGQAVGLFAAQPVRASGLIPAQILFLSVLPDEVASAGVQTPISAPALQKVAVANITTTTTSTGLSYMVTSRYDETGIQSVYAMPLVTMASTTANNGKIADFDSIAQTFKIYGTSYRVQGFDEVITDAAQIDIQGQADVVARLQVGAGAVPLNSGEFINQLIAQGDAVYISIQQAFAAGSTPGMFKSQALFDDQGRIMCWSPWQRVAGTDDQILFAIKNRVTDATMYVSGASSNTIQQTTWNNNDANLATFMSKVSGSLPKNNGGVQSFIPFPTTTAGFTNLPTSQICMLAATGNNTVILGQTAQLVDETLQILEQTEETSIILNSDNSLSIGSVVSATVGTGEADQNWFFFAGDAGVAVLSSNDGTGFTTLPNDGAAASLIADGQTCKTIGNFTWVKKVIADETYVYVMTQDAVYRFVPAVAQFTIIDAADLEAELVVTAASLAQNAYCTDMLVDNGLIILGTTSGLFSINVQSDVPGVVTPITIPGGLPTVSCMQTISKSSNFNQDFYDASNLYVLSVNYALQQACLNRFTISDGEIVAIEDQLLEGQNGPLLVYDYMNNSIFIDGSLGFATSYRMGSTPAAVRYMQYILQAGKSSTQVSLKNHTSAISIAPLLNALGLAGMVREYATGALLLGGSFGMYADS